MPKTASKQGKQKVAKVKGIVRVKSDLGHKAKPKTAPLTVAPFFYKRLAGRRYQLGLTQTQLERACDPALPETSISRYEKMGGPVPRQKVLVSIAKALKCSVEQLANRWPEVEAIDVPTDSAGAKVYEYRNGFTGPVA